MGGGVGTQVELGVEPPTGAHGEQEPTNICTPDSLNMHVERVGRAQGRLGERGAGVESPQSPPETGVKHTKSQLMCTRPRGRRGCCRSRGRSGAMPLNMETWKHNAVSLQAWDGRIMLGRGPRERGQHSWQPGTRASPPTWHPHLAITARVVHDQPLVLRQQAVLQQQWVVPLHGRSGHATGRPCPPSSGHEGAQRRGCACKHFFSFLSFRLQKPFLPVTLCHRSSQPCCLPLRVDGAALGRRQRVAPAFCPCIFAASSMRHKWTWNLPCTRCCGCAKAQRQCAYPTLCFSRCD